MFIVLMILMMKFRVGSLVLVFVVVVHLVGPHRFRALLHAQPGPSSSASGSVFIRNSHQAGLAVLKVVVLFAHPHELLVGQVVAVVDLFADSVASAVFLLLFCCFGLNKTMGTASTNHEGISSSAISR